MKLSVSKRYKIINIVFKSRNYSTALTAEIFNASTIKCTCCICVYTYYFAGSTKNNPVR